MKKVDISILMPVFNAEKYIENSIESIKSQTFENWELIIINNGSIDNSGSICDAFANSDSRIKVIHGENIGISNSRNILLKNASGKYIGFVDADDKIDRKMFSCLYESLITNNSDMSVCGFNEEKLNKGVVVSSQSKIYYPQEVLKIVNMKDEFMEFGNSETLNPLWNKLYSRKIIEINNIKFPEKVKTGEDLIFNLKYLENIKTISFCKESLYYYEKRDNGSITYQYVDNMYDKVLAIYIKLDEFLKKMNFYTEKNKQILNGNYLKELFFVMLNLFHKDCPMGIKEKKKYIRDIISRDYVKEYAKNKNRYKGIIRITSILVRINSPMLIIVIVKSISLFRRIKV